MSDLPVNDPPASHTLAQKRAGETAPTFDNEHSQRGDITAPHFSSANMPGRDGVPQIGQDTSNTPHGVLASAHNAIHNATETIKHYLPGSVSTHLRVYYFSSLLDTMIFIDLPEGSNSESASQSTQQDPPRSSGGVPHNGKQSMHKSLAAKICELLQPLLSYDSNALVP